MLFQAAFLGFQSLATALPAPSNNLPQCDTDQTGHELSKFNTYASQACNQFFQQEVNGPVGNTIHWNVGYRGGDGSVWLWEQITFKLDGDTPAMNEDRCRNAFTIDETFKYNQDKGHICKSASGTTLIKAWDFVKEGRMYHADTTAKQCGTPRVPGDLLANLESWNGDFKQCVQEKPRRS